jgi:hypothetical protein
VKNAALQLCGSVLLAARARFKFNQFRVLRATQIDQENGFRKAEFR